MPAPTSTTQSQTVVSTPTPIVTTPVVNPSFLQIVKLNFDLKKAGLELLGYLIGLLLTGLLSFSVHFLSQNPDAFGLSTIVIGKILGELLIAARAYFGATL